MFILAVLAATGAWFIAAAILFFNPVVDKIYSLEENHAAVKRLPKSPLTIGKIFLAVLIQSAAWGYVFYLISPSLGGVKLYKGLWFGLILVLTKIIPRDIDRILLTTYPPKRMTIEFVIGIICSFIVGLVFAFMI